MAKPIRQVRKTLLIVCEGARDELFLQHLRMLYLREPGAVSMVIRRSDGGGGNGVCKRLMTIDGQYDRYLAMFDGDRPPDADWLSRVERFRAKGNTVEKLAICPQCLEGMILGLLDQKAHETSEKCKKGLARYSNKADWLLNDFQRHLPRELLDSRRAQVQPLDGLLTIMLDWG